jgi:hypothetical protein
MNSSIRKVPHYIYRRPIFTPTSPGRRIFHTDLNTSDSNLECLFASFYCYRGGYVYHANRQLYGPFLTRTRLGGIWARSENPEISSRRTTIPATRQRLDRMSIIGSFSSRMVDFCKGASRPLCLLTRQGKGICRNNNTL